ncbi:MAG: IS21 family transposase, partial [Solirubrobacterales bacterium]|nr:IS21 family transposase [Solirubrobacterales bacterium]
MSKVELYERIRREHDAGVSIRELARRHRMHRRVVRQAIADALPPARKTPERASPAMGAYEEIVRGWLREDLKAPRKQRHTARRVWQRLVGEHGAELAESTVRVFVARARAELAEESVRTRATVPQSHPPGAEAEVDFTPFTAVIAGVTVVLQLFVMRLSHSGRAYAVAFAHQAQEAFLEGHVQAFAHFDGVPARIRYDNLKDAVVRVLRGRDRVENQRFTALRSHYLYESFFCAPGVEGAHEKGGVEGEGGRFRRTHLVPVPEAASLAELNRMIAGWVLADDERVITGRSQTVGAAFAVEQPALRGLPAERFDSARTLSCKVDGKARIVVLQARYSVPVRFIGRRLPVRLGAVHVEVRKPGSDAIVAVHERSLHKHVDVLELDHYLELLVRKPGALPGATALAQARAAGRFTPMHEEFWARARRKLGDAAGTRALIDVLLLHRRVAAGHVRDGIRAALRVDSVDPAVVAIEARRCADGHGDDPRAGRATVIPLPSRLPPDPRTPPTLFDYDQLLHTAAQD